MGSTDSPAKLELRAYRTLWGNTKPLDAYLPTLKERGYVGVETGLLFLTDDQKRELPGLLKQHQLDLILTVISFGKNQRVSEIPISDDVDDSVREHLESFRVQVEEAMAFPVRPQAINVQGGVDCWTVAQTDAFYERVVALEQRWDRDAENSGLLPIPIVHETHRSKCFHTPWTTAETLLKFPALKVNCDLSHWLVVCERYLTQSSEFQEMLNVVVERCHHVHARVASCQQIQVHDPRDPQSGADVQELTKLWLRIWKSQRKRGLGVSTITPEYGPVPYAPVQPFSKSEPTTADLDHLCDAEIKRLQKLFEELIH